MKKIIIVGGGTAGLIIAIMLKKSNPDFVIEIIKSDDIGIIGVGEGSTEHWFQFLNYAEINIYDLFANTDCTFKYGIHFQNWNNDNKNFYHLINNFFTFKNINNFPSYEVGNISLANNLNEIHDSYMLESKHFFPLENSTYQFHFDTFKLNQFLIKLALERDIKVTIDTVTDIELDENGIKFIQSKNNVYKADFFVDATGFKKMLINKLNPKWIDCQEFLIANSAITFTLKPIVQNNTSFTSAISSKHGWIWEIPTQTRTGRGYVFNKDISSIEEIENDLKNLYKNINIEKNINFTAGYLENPWIKNCLAIGLASNFVEPLEASNIGCTIQQSFAFIQFINNLNLSNNIQQKTYNNICTNIFSNIIDFIQIHYKTKRQDSKFWIETNNTKLTPFNKTTLDYFKNNIPIEAYFDKSYIMFNQHNWINILFGLEYINLEVYKEIFNNLPNCDKHEFLVKKEVYANRVPNFTSNVDAIKLMKTYATN